MIFEQKTILNFYKKLLAFYPQIFRERFGESMAQTFNDLCNEQKRLKGKVSLAFIFSMFAETSIGVIRENLAGANQMNYWLKTFGIAVLFSFLFTTAFFTFGTFFTDNPDAQSGNIFSDFFRSWLILTLIFTPIVNGLCSGEQISAKDFLFPLTGAAIFGLLLTAPFAFMEYWNNPRIQSGEFQFPYPLFLGLWLAPVLFFLGATPIMRSLRTGENVLTHPVSLILRIIFLAILAIFWVNLIRDQMPCFLGGVPGCD